MERLRSHNTKQDVSVRKMALELLEPRQLLAAAPLTLGIVFVEGDTGTDRDGDVFEVAFHGGAPGTTLQRMVISGDRDRNGFGEGDVIFDSDSGGVGADAAAPFQLMSLETVDPTARISAQVEDGSTELVLEFEQFHAGDKLVFQIDVDEVQWSRGDDQTDVAINDGLDPITSGVEFQGSVVLADFSAPDYKMTAGEAVFYNRYDALLDPTQLPLREDDFADQRDRTAGAVLHLQQQLNLATLTGSVYHDQNQNHQRDSDEQGIDGVLVRLSPIDTTQSALVQETQTDEDGQYRFEGISPGIYDVVEVVQPSPYLDGGETVGSVDGIPSGTMAIVGDGFNDVELPGGSDARGYDFGEILPVSIEGAVEQTGPANRCDAAPLHLGLAGVRVSLADVSGRVIAEVATDQNGTFAFPNLAPGDYRVTDRTPESFFDGPDQLGMVIGEGSQYLENNGQFVTELGSGAALVQLHFCETPPSSISGNVFRDGAPVDSDDGAIPENLSEIRDGLRTVDDQPIEGVVLELRHGVTGNPVQASWALPGIYPSGDLHAKSDENGYYEFPGLPPGLYSVYEIQPQGFVDGIDHPGTTAGIAINPNDPLAVSVAAGLAVDPLDDAIVNIVLPLGTDSQHNDFSEVALRSVTTQTPVTPRTPSAPRQFPAVSPRAPLWTTPISDRLPTAHIVPHVGYATPSYDFDAGHASMKYSWHLSIINGGDRRDDGRVSLATTTATVSWNSSGHWTPGKMNNGFWQFVGEDDELPNTIASMKIGMRNGIPVAGDFNGDGVDEIGFFLDGEWYLDFNGNGRWDPEDLWAKLGSAGDLPVIGDWDGDGKDDIGIFGPEWRRDRDVIGNDRGMPDRAYATKSQIDRTDSLSPRDRPCQDPLAANHARIMQHSAHGIPKAHAIDHVFRFGNPGAIPVAGDFNGDRVSTIGTFCQGRWYLDINGDGRLDSPDQSYLFGQIGDLPVVGDFDGDGTDEIGVYRNGTWIIDVNGNFRIDPNDRVVELGGSEQLPVVADTDGDGIDEPGVFGVAPNRTAGGSAPKR